MVMVSFRFFRAPFWSSRFFLSVLVLKCANPNLSQANLCKLTPTKTCSSYNTQPKITPWHSGLGFQGLGLKA